MIETARALYQYFSGFGIPAYAENTVPDEAELPYLTYPQKEPYWDRQSSFWVIVYYRNRDSNFEALNKADEIVRDIWDGKRLKTDHGLVVIRPDGADAVQAMPPNGDVRAAYIQLTINAYHTPGV